VVNGIVVPGAEQTDGGVSARTDFSHERWLMTAARAGLSIASPRRRVPDVERLDALFVVTVVADRWFGDVETPLGEQAVRLAALVRAELLTVRFDGREPEAAFVGAEPSSTHSPGRHGVLYWLALMDLARDFALGLPGDDPFDAVASAPVRRRADFTLLDQREVLDQRIELDVSAPPGGELWSDSLHIVLDEVRALYPSL